MDERLLERVVQVIEDFTGLRSPPANRSQLRRALEKLARNHDTDPAQIASRIERDPAARQELLNSVMIGETYFFREAAQFRLLRNQLLPDMARARRAIRCWSVSCSTGEEAVSLAVLLDDLCRTVPGLDYRVYASDINTRSLERLRTGVFPRSSLRRDGTEFHSLLLERHISAQEERSITISPRLREKITVLHLNFYRDHLHDVPEDLDVVFFRNTLLYAPPEKRAGIIAPIVQRLRPRGYLFLATSELPFAEHPEMVLRDFGAVYALHKAPAGEQSARVDSAPPTEAGSEAGPEAKPEAKPEARHQEPHGADHRAGSRSRTRTPPLTSDSILHLLNRDSPTPDSRETREPDAAAVAARLVVECYGAVNAGQLDRAAVVADELCAAANDTALAFFCAGWTHYTAGNRDDAIHAFHRALELDESFWPARFYSAGLRAGTLDTAGHRRAVRLQFERCIATIDHMEASGRGGIFSFLLEGFSPAYFRRMCARWIEKTKEKERT